MKVSIIIPTQNRADDVINCIDSILISSFNDFEIIVVDNASNDETPLLIKNKFSNNKRIKLIESDINLGAGGGRNRGAKEANGKLLLFIDSDNVIDSEMVKLLVDFVNKKDNCGMVGPLILFKDDPNLIWLYFADINMWTSKASYKGTGEQDAKQYKEIEDVGHIPNCFMVRRKDFEKVGGFDEKYLVMFEEADFAEKIKRLGKKINIYTKAKTYHNIPLPEKSLRGGATFKNERIAFLTSRNRVYFMKKNANFFQFFIFLFIFLPFSLIYYQFSLLRRKEFNKAVACLKGSAQGLLM